MVQCTGIITWKKKKNQKLGEKGNEMVNFATPLHSSNRLVTFF